MKSPTFLFALGCALLCPLLSAATPTEFLPPALPWRGASEALVVGPDHPWITPAEKTGLLDSPSYDDTVAWLRRLAAASPLIQLQTFGHTAQGRPLWLVIASRTPGLTPATARAERRPILLAQGGIHSGEIDGKDAGLMLLRDLAFGGKTALLDGAHFLFVPVFNADGHERRSAWNRPNQRGPVHQGWRTTAQNLNLNRDYLKADSPEMRAMIRLLDTWQPSLTLDIHVTDGIDYQYDITFGYNGDAGGFAASPRIAAWLNGHYRPAATKALQSAGHIPGELVFAADDRDPAKGVGTGPSRPRLSHGYGDLRHLPTVLVENHSLKPYPQRVLGTYVLLEASLRALASSARALADAISADSAARPAAVAINWSEAKGETTTADFLGIAYETYVSPVSGGPEVRWTGQPKTYPALPRHSRRPALSLPRPKAYWVPVTKPEVIDRLRLHGVQLETLPAARRVDVEMYRLVDPKPAPLPNEGRHSVSADVKVERRTEEFPAGSVRVSLDQPLGGLALTLLEPRSSDSLFAWGFFPEILQRTEYIEGYVIAPLAEKMLAADPALQREFAARLAADPAFAKNPTARLQWCYERTRFADDRYLLYPIGVER